jgi:hypothetical protein
MKHLTFLGILLFLASCASIKPTDLRPDGMGCSQLPTLEPIVDINSLESMYPTRTFSTYDQYGNEETVTLPPTRHKRAQDVYTLFERDVKDCISTPYGEFKGYIICNIRSGNSRMDDMLPIVSIFTLGIPNILGMPYTFVKSYIDMDVEIYTPDDILVGRYSGSGKNTSYARLYGGYRISEVGRISAIKSFKTAMNKIKEEIEKDKARLTVELNAEQVMSSGN